MSISLSCEGSTFSSEHDTHKFVETTLRIFIWERLVVNIDRVNFDPELDTGMAVPLSTLYVLSVNPDHRIGEPCT